MDSMAGIIPTAGLVADIILVYFVVVADFLFFSFFFYEWEHRMNE